jgi:glycosyltransferase involved in cell wall biosynthesis
MKLLFVAPNLDVGGIERQWSILIPALRERGHDVRLITIDGRGPFFDKLVAEGIRAECLDVTRRVFAWRLIGKLRKPDHPDLVVSRGTSGLVFGDLLARRTGAHHVWMDHSGPDASGRGKLLRRDQRLLVRAFRGGVDRVIAVSTTQIAPLAQRGFAASRIAVIANGIDAREFRTTRPPKEVRQEIGVGGDGVMVLFVARLRPEKRVDRFLSAVERARTAAPQLHGVVVGDGPDFESVRRHCSNNSGITALGARHDIADLMEASDIVCLTSDIEAMPLAALEAMAVGRPVVAPDVGGVSGVVADGATGFVVTPGSADAVAAALVCLAEDAELRIALGRAGQLRLRERFSVETMVDGYEREFAAVTSARLRRAPRLASLLGIAR